MINNLIKKGLHLFTFSFFVLNPIQAEMFSIPFGKNTLRSYDLEVEVSLKSKLILEKSEIILNCFNDEGFKTVFGINLNPVSVNHIYSHNPESNEHSDVNTSLNVHDKPIICQPTDLIDELINNKNTAANFIYIEDTLFTKKTSILNKNILRI